MVATFVNIIQECLKQLVHYFLSNNHLCNYGILKPFLAMHSVNVVKYCQLGKALVQ